jgi:nucleotidyltransferase substrate binding protein (TIGR01987 family)
MSDRKKLDTFSKTLAKLREFVAIPIENERDRAGIIQAFEFTFEQCWKTFQRIVIAEGFEARSPRESLQGAMCLMLIRPEDENVWIQMLKDRNMTSHVYHESLAIEISDRIVKDYLPLLMAVNKKLS